MQTECVAGVFDENPQASFVVPECPFHLNALGDVSTNRTDGGDLPLFVPKSET